MGKQPDWQAVILAGHFTDEVDCNSGARRRVFADGRIEPLEGDPLADEEELPPEAAQTVETAVDSAGRNGTRMPRNRLISTRRSADD